MAELSRSERHALMGPSWKADVAAGRRRLESLHPDDRAEFLDDLKDGLAGPR